MVIKITVTVLGQFTPGLFIAVPCSSLRTVLFPRNDEDKKVAMNSYSYQLSRDEQSSDEVSEDELS